MKSGAKALAHPVLRALAQESASIAVALRSFLPPVSTLASGCPPVLSAAGLQWALMHSLVKQWQPDTLMELRGRWLLIEVRDLGWRFWITRGAQGLRVSAVPQAQDVRIAGSAEAFSRMLNGQTDPDTLFFRRQLSIEGDTALGLAIKNQLDQFDWSQLPVSQRKLLNVISAWICRDS